MGKKYLKKDATKRVFRCTNHKKQTPPTRVLPPPLYELTDKFLKSELLFSPRAHKFYRQKTKYKKKIPKQKLFFLMRECLKVVKERLLENESGVFIDNFGYFCIMRHPERKIRNFYFGGYKFKGKYIPTSGCIYSPVFLPIRKDSSMHQWTMDKAFDKRVISSLKYRLVKKGKKYRMSLIVLNNLYGRENSKIELPIKKQEN